MLVIISFKYISKFFMCGHAWVNFRVLTRWKCFTQNTIFKLILKIYEFSLKFHAERIQHKHTNFKTRCLSKRKRKIILLTDFPTWQDGKKLNGWQLIFKEHSSLKQHKSKYFNNLKYFIAFPYNCIVPSHSNSDSDASVSDG